MYLFRDDILNIYNQRAIAREVGITPETMNRIFRRKQKCSKMVAFCICKAINKNAEIEDFFEFKKKGE